MSEAAAMCRRPTTHRHLWVMTLVVALGPVFAFRLLSKDLMANWWNPSTAITHIGGLQQPILSWHPPAPSPLTNLSAALHGSGVYGFLFDSSATPDAHYGTYNWCNMPHVRPREYPRPPPAHGAALRLAFVEVLQRHHKRTPYAANAFPVEPARWDCPDASVLSYARRAAGAGAVPVVLAESTGGGDANPFARGRLQGSCRFPQLTAGGFEDAVAHGEDLYAVYHGLLGLLPLRDAGEAWRRRTVYRATNNPLTTQVAGALVQGMWGGGAAAAAAPVPVPVQVQAVGADSLEPQFACPAAEGEVKGMLAGAEWKDHLRRAGGLFAALGEVSGVADADEGFHASFDHYFDNLSARQCHGRRLPCRAGVAEGGEGREPPGCITREQAEAVYRLGQWEYSHLYRGHTRSLAASVGAFGVWPAELASHLRAVVEGRGGEVVYVHNVAHDGSVSRLLSLLQADDMVWPGMGAEVVFELWEKKVIEKEFFVRVLFGGRVLTSSNPSLGVMDMLPAGTLLAYLDGLVGRDGSLMLAKCNGSIPLM